MSKIQHILILSQQLTIGDDNYPISIKIIIPQCRAICQKEHMLLSSLAETKCKELNNACATNYFYHLSFHSRTVRIQSDHAVELLDYSSHHAVSIYPDFHVVNHQRHRAGWHSGVCNGRRLFSSQSHAIENWADYPASFCWRPIYNRCENVLTPKSSRRSANHESGHNGQCTRRSVLPAWLGIDVRRAVGDRMGLSPRGTLLGNHQ